MTTISTATTTLALPPAALALPATQADLAALLAYDADHADGRPWKWPGVTADARGRFRVRLREDAPWGGDAGLDLAGRHPTERAAAQQLVRYLKWRYGVADWRPRADRPPDVEAFDDEVDGGPPSWVGRAWVNGTPVLVFADAATEAGFAEMHQALDAAREWVKARLAGDWRVWLGRAKRPWVGPLPAGLLDPPPSPAGG